MTQTLTEKKSINQNRMKIGHHTSPEFIQLYWADRRGNLELRFSIDPNETSRLGKDHRMFEKNAKGLAKMPFKGRIDHKYREISILPKDAKSAKKSNYEKLVGNVVKKLKKKFRNYSIFFYDDVVQDMMLAENKKNNTHKYEFVNKSKMNGFVKTLKELSLGQKVSTEDMTVIVTVKNPMNLDIIDSLANDYKASLEEITNIDFIAHNLLLNEESININDNIISQYNAACMLVFYNSLKEDNQIKFKKYLDEDFDRMLNMVLSHGESNG